MFTNKFIALPFLTYDGKTQKLTGQDLSEVNTLIQTIKINPLEIETYEEAIPASHEFSEENLIATEVYMKSGNSFVINMKMSDFEKILNDYYNEAN